MMSPLCLHKKITIRDQEFFFYVPKTTGEILFWSIEICGSAITTGVLTSEQIVAMARWVSNYSENLTAERVLEIFEPQDLVDIGNALVQAASLPPEILDGVRQALFVTTKANDYDREMAEKPCECRACNGQADTDKNCLFVGVPPLAITLISLRKVAEHPELLAAPYWVFQLRQQIENATALGLAGIRQAGERERRSQERAKEIRKNILGSSAGW